MSGPRRIVFALEASIAVEPRARNRRKKDLGFDLQVLIAGASYADLEMLSCNILCYVTGDLQVRKSFFYKALCQLTVMTRSSPFKNPFPSFTT